jgi:hemolysin activation/secretion protein
VLQDTARFLSKAGLANVPNFFEPDNFVGAQVNYNLALVKDSVLPDRGMTLSLMAKHTQNLRDNEKSFQRFSGMVQFFIPLIPKISLAIKTGATTITGGTPLFYQYPTIGESFDLRGFRRERFSGETTFYNNTELRYIKKVKSNLFNGKAGLIAFIDNGRVWLPGENSNKMHTTYGGGILLAPFNVASVAVTYGVSDEIKLVQLRLGVLF